MKTTTSPEGTEKNAFDRAKFPDPVASDPAKMGWMVGSLRRLIARFALMTAVTSDSPLGAGAFQISAS